MSPGGKVKSLFSSLIHGGQPGDGNNGPRTVEREDGLYTAKVSDALFASTTVEADGEECLHDCDSCMVKLPKGFKIDESDKLFGMVKGWTRHLVVATGKTDWVRDVADEKDSVMEAIGNYDSLLQGGRLMVSASNMPVPEDPHHMEPYGQDRLATVLLLPAFQFVDNVTPRHVPELIRSVINFAPTNLAPMPSPSQPAARADQRVTWLNDTNLPAGLKLRDCPHQYLILMCSQATRDARCGQSAPLLRKEFERHLRHFGLFRDMGDERPGGAGVYFVSHVGGHKYSANVMIYRRGTLVESKAGTSSTNGSVANDIVNRTTRTEPLGEAAQCIWLARVRPEHCENIVRYTVLQGKVVKPDRQLRGGFDREKGVVSW